MNINPIEMITIRNANLSDAEIIASFQLKMAKETEGILLHRPTTEQGVRKVFSTPALGNYYVAESAHQIIASLLVTYEWSDWRNGMVYWIQSVYVIPEYRTQGVFTQMYQYIKEKVKQDPSVMGIRLYVDKTNQRATKVYQNVGMDGDHYALFEWMKE